MFLPTAISDTAVHLAFCDTGTVHQVFAGTYEKDFHEIQNGKHHIRLTPYVKNEIPHQICFEGQNREFIVYWAEKEVLCKKCKTVHMLKISCEDAQKLMEGGNGADENVVAISEPVVSDVAVTLNQLQVHPSETGEKNPEVVTYALGPTYPEVVVGTLQETQGVIHGLRVIQSGSSAQECGNMGSVCDSWTDDEADCQTSSRTLSDNVKANDVELGQAGPSEQASRNMNEVHDSCLDDDTDCQDAGQLQSSSYLDNKATTSVISRDVEMNDATAAETKRDSLNAQEKTNHPAPWSSCQSTRSDAPSSATMTSVTDETSSAKVPLDLT